MQNNNNNKLLFVVNPISGDIDKKRFSIKVKKFSEELDFSFHLYETTGKNDAENIKNEIKSYKPNIVVAVGGDGTCNMVATILKNTRLSMGILPRGSANGMANELNLPDNLEESLKVFLENNVRTIDMLKINDEYFSMHLGDIGLNAIVVQRFEEENSRGFFGYVKQFLKEIFRTSPRKFYFELDGRKFYTRSHMVVFANASKYGTGAIINPRGSLDDGFFELIIIKPYTFLLFLRASFSIFSGKLDQLEFVETIKARKAKIYNLENLPVQADGELLDHLPEVTVENVPRCLKLLVPWHAKSPIK